MFVGVGGGVFAISVVGYYFSCIINLWFLSMSCPMRCLCWGVDVENPQSVPSAPPFKPDNNAIFCIAATVDNPSTNAISAIFSPNINQ